MDNTRPPGGILRMLSLDVSGLRQPHDDDWLGRKKPELCQLPGFPQGRTARLLIRASRRYCNDLTYFAASCVGRPLRTFRSTWFSDHGLNRRRVLLLILSEFVKEILNVGGVLIYSQPSKQALAFSVQDPRATRKGDLSPSFWFHRDG